MRSPRLTAGRTARGQLLKGQPVLESLLAPMGAAGVLQALVPAGMRAMTIEVNEFSSVGGMVTPGSRVDTSRRCRIRGAAKA
ncbi:MAG TPA: RcpC/CpaB family pilus assembly protein [Tepidisphaeraceae bacterium]|nr:RcpC/CpaB family pilus assembly protein [Tepidisphaeraceae bacterium]